MIERIFAKIVFLYLDKQPRFTFAPYPFLQKDTQLDERSGLNLNSLSSFAAIAKKQQQKILCATVIICDFDNLIMCYKYGSESTSQYVIIMYALLSYNNIIICNNMQFYNIYLFSNLKWENGCTVYTGFLEHFLSFNLWYDKIMFFFFINRQKINKIRKFQPPLSWKTAEIFSFSQTKLILKSLYENIHQCLL